MSDHVVLQQAELDRVWQTIDPFLFSVHHNDDHPEGDDELGPCAPLVGRNIGMDFSGQDGWSMYHGHDYQETHFGGWPWDADDPHHGQERRRFVRHADGRVEELAGSGN